MSRYRTVRNIVDKKLVRIGTANLPDHEDSNSDILLISTEGDRCDLLSQEYYGTPDFWWFIANVNNLNKMNLEPGTRLRIPTSIAQANTF